MILTSTEKKQVQSISIKMKGSIGILSKLRYSVHFDVLINLYYSFIYPLLTYGLVVRDNTYPTNINPLFILQKRTFRITTFSKFNEHSRPLFKQTKKLKLSDLIKFQISIFMYTSSIKVNYPWSSIELYFLSISKVHNYQYKAVL